MPGRGNLTITGRAGDVMQESAQAALSYARSRAEQLKIAPRLPGEDSTCTSTCRKAPPQRTAPRAGITMATALISALTRHPVRSDTAMTGEITLARPGARRSAG